jgi:hypothetical protein
MKNDRVLSQMVKALKNREADPLRPLIDEYLIERNRSPRRLREYTIDMVERPRPGGRFSPSGMCGCQRAAIFKFVGMPGRAKIDPDKQLIFEHGDWVHHKWQAIFLDMERVLGKEKFKVISTEAAMSIPELYTAGSSDNQLRMGPPRRSYVLDIKSINDQGFQRVMREGKPIPKHVQQLVTYLKGHNKRWGFLFYDNKNNQQTQGFVIEYEHGEFVKVSSWVEDTLEFLAAEQLPGVDSECTNGVYLYEKCRYAHLCFGNVSEKKVRIRTYKDFPGIDEAWEAGHEVIRNHV